MHNRRCGKNWRNTAELESESGKANHDGRTRSKQPIVTDLRVVEVFVPTHSAYLFDDDAVCPFH